MQMANKKNAVEALAVSTSTAAEMLGVSRPKVYDLMRQEGFPCFKVGGRTLISVDGLREWVRVQAEQGVSA